MLRLLPLLSLANPESGHGGGNAPAELILVSLLLLIFWGVFRVTKKRST